VLGVAATRRDLRTAADYSNRGALSLGAWPGHICTFGGNVVPAAAANQSATTDPADSIVGIFSGPSLPGGATNTSGWVRWAGTSFSTPLVAGVAARLLTVRPDLGPLELMAWLRSFAHHLHTGADPNSPLEVSVLKITQA
jgi:subtilisin family serine protease